MAIVLPLACELDPCMDWVTHGMGRIGPKQNAPGWA